MEKILIVEDDYELNKSISYLLWQEAYETVSAHTLTEAKELYMKSKVDLVLLDVNLPDGEGFTFCEWILGQGEVPVIFLTARDLEEDILKGYELGAWDYVTKPFSMKVLLKKISVVLSKNKREQDNLVFDDGFLYINLRQACVKTGGCECAVTPTEYRLLEEFLSHGGQLLTYDVLMDRIWDRKNLYVDKHALAVNVNRLRGKIEDNEHKYIANVYGMGYQWLA